MKYQEIFKLYQSFTGETAFEQRTQKGRQPVLEIAGYPWFVNLRTGLLEPIDWPAVDAIELENLKLIRPFSDTLYFYYDPAKKEQLPYPLHISWLPKGAVKVEIPPLYVLDPVGAARNNHPDDIRFYIGEDCVIAGGNGLYTLYHQAKVTPMLLQQQKSKGRKL